jgi:hypothetical protein
MATDKADKATFTSWKFNRLDEAMGDQSLTPAARVMAYWIMKHVNQHTQDAHVGLRCLMRESGFGVDTTTRSIDQLVAHGYFEKTPGKQGRGGRGNESRYRPLEKSSTIGPFGGEKESDDRTLSTDARAEKESDFTKERVRFCVEKSPTIGTEHLEHLNKHLSFGAQERPKNEKVDDAAEEEIQTIEKGSAVCSPEESQPTSGSKFTAAMDAIQREYDGGLIDKAEAHQRLKNLTRGLSPTSQQPPAERPASGFPEEAKPIALPSNVVPLSRRTDAVTEDTTIALSPIVPDPAIRFRSRRPKGNAAEPNVVRGSRLPADWQPTDADAEFARSILSYAHRVEIEKFRDYWTAKAGAQAVKADWSATWRNWVRRAAEQRGLSPEPPKPKRHIP